MDAFLLAALFAGGIVLWRFSRNRQLGFAALGLIVVLFVSPFCALSSALFSARVAHHVLLTAVIAPTLVFALPRLSLRWSGSLTLWTGLQALTFWAWHWPMLYGYALSSTALYWLMQVTLGASALGFWALLRRSGQPAAVAALLFSTVQMGLLGALITFAGAPLYAPHLFTTAPWGLSALEDQQLAGLIMWAPSAALYLGAALVVASRWLSCQERELTA